MVVFRGDPCGIICIFITYSAVFYADYVVVRHLVMPTLSETLWGAVHALAYNTIIFLLVLAHMRAVFSDPGIIPITDLERCGEPGNQVIKKAHGDWTVCMKCETYRPPRAHHCRICRRCIRRMDHHCPWINNCVGEYNQKFFLQFIVYVGLASVYSLGLVVAAWVMDPEAHSHSARHSRLIHSLVLVIESMLFGLFVIAIGCDQAQSILSDETAVEQVKRGGNGKPMKRKNVKQLMQQVFGKGPVYLWLCPFYSLPPPPPHTQPERTILTV